MSAATYLSITAQIKITLYIQENNSIVYLEGYKTEASESRFYTEIRRGDLGDKKLTNNTNK
jgi:hypothetical protein